MDGGGCVVQVWMDGPLGAIEAPFYLVETEFPDFASFLEAVDADRLIGAARLDTHRGEERGERVVHRRVAVAFRGREVRRAVLPSWRIVEG